VLQIFAARRNGSLVAALVERERDIIPTVWFRMLFSAAPLSAALARRPIQRWIRRCFIIRDANGATPPPMQAEASFRTGSGSFLQG